MILLGKSGDAGAAEDFKPDEEESLVHELLHLIFGMGLSPKAQTSVLTGRSTGHPRACEVEKGKKNNNEKAGPQRPRLFVITRSECDRI